MAAKSESANSFLVDMLVSMLGNIPPWESIDAWIVPGTAPKCSFSGLRHLPRDRSALAFFFAPRYGPAALFFTLAARLAASAPCSLIGEPG